MEASRDFHGGGEEAPAVEAAEPHPEHDEQHTRVQQRGDRRAEREAAMAERSNEHEVERDVERDACRAGDDRHPAVAQGIEGRRDELDGRIAHQARRVAHECRGGGRGVGGRESARARRSSDTIGVASTSSPSVAGTFSISIMRSPLDTAWRSPGSLRLAAWPEIVGQRGGGDRNAEQPDRHVHQPERVIEP